MLFLRQGDTINFACEIGERIDAWLSLVERSVRDAEVAGSNPVASTESDKIRYFEAWLSLVEHHVRDVGVAGSNPVASTKEQKPFFNGF